MDDTPEFQTRVSLLDRLRRDPTDEPAWRDFVRLYGTRIHNWCRRWGLQEADAQDVTQQVLLKLAEGMRDFAYNPALSFRSWLKTVTQNAWHNYVRHRERLHRIGGDASNPDTVLGILDQVPAREDLTRRLEEQYDHELLEQAKGRVRLRVEPHTWEAFRLTALEGLSGPEAAERIGIAVGLVYVAKKRVAKMIRDEVQKLDA
jgi:RNA polymerase sigma-70 factor (ECF subfamily)